MFCEVFCDYVLLCVYVLFCNCVWVSADGY